MNKTKIMLATILTFVATSLVMANPTFPPCVTNTEINPSACHKLKCCTDACESLCPVTAGDPLSDPQHTKCYEGCNALDLE